MTNVLAPLFAGENAIALSGVLDEVIGLLPVVIPVVVTFIGLRKGIGFLQSILHSA